MIDSHAHLNHPRFDEDRGEVIDRCWEAGLEAVVDVGCWPTAADRERSLDLARGNDGVYSALGVHPHDVGRMEPGSFEHVAALCAEPEVVAVGETGLDYYYDHSPRDVQRDAFRSFLSLAGKLDKPVVVHSRDADEDTIAILRDAGAGLRGVVHCFSSGPALAECALELGWSLGFTGIVTFPGAESVRDVVRSTPMDRILVETDAPYLAPVPRRGRRNEPALVAHTVARVAELKGVTAAAAATETAANARRLFAIPGGGGDGS